MTLAKAAAQQEMNAYHEAGHVVAGWNKKLKIIEATIIPTSKYHGRVSVLNTLRGERRRAEAQIVMLLAGPIAERRFMPEQYRIIAHTDSMHAVEIAMKVHANDVETSLDYLDQLEQVAHDEVNTSWPTIERVARALIERNVLYMTEIAALCRSKRGAKP